MKQGGSPGFRAIMECQECQKHFEIMYSKYKKGQGKFCSTSCTYKGRNSKGYNDLTGKKFGKLKVNNFLYIKRIAYFSCTCDCGNEKIVAGSYLKNGHIKSCGCSRKKGNSGHFKKGHKLFVGERNPQWKGENVKYRALHKRMYDLVKKPKKCKICKNKKPLQLANKSQKYLYDKKDWMWLCSLCHSRYDHNWKMIKGNWWKNCTICNVLLEANEQNFYQVKSKKRIMSMSICKKCSSIKCKEYRTKINVQKKK